MPRPGPKPYDCVKRAWHSEIHQPIRGTLIQEIFRVVNEIHGSSTKKNKEYQEKLPVVVLRAEEIIYSKANSEAEYMDLTTLLERTNDAIDTIIRRDEHTETGEYLRPCIEATRSQRNNQRCYLSRSTEEVPKLSYGTLHNTANTKDHNNTRSQCVSENVPSASKKQCVEHQPPPKLFSVYPLYYGNNNNIQLGNSQHHHGFKVSHVSVSHTGGPALVGGDGARNLLAHNLKNSSNGGSQSFIINGDFENPCTRKCDLSLRLGPP
ncbi:uncharacterized protein LOC114408958 isoform X2 [Glycine soja]|uniref:Histone acetyltransferase n=1 Tax=Glycine soja TaxID=3848 RepID=A0A445KWT5_GLYSO|nr:uncharacterized protein LOC100803816 isoform X2 [Glycine max]XP_028227994.1 uncharacterized protein LOC114408958 isoform X2 [Glycine soja]RZC15359.1 hypothetical protein D0Y65_008972 [Glycine soja]|eukprot:XP_006578142.1 uncharacterized protein LOC100803816 isoform X2 [Glycine max]